MPPRRSTRATVASSTLPNAQRTAKKKKKQLVGSPSIDDLSAKKLVQLNTSQRRKRTAATPISVMTRRQKQQQQPITELENDDDCSSQSSMSSESSNSSMSRGSNYSSTNNSREPSPTLSNSLSSAATVQIRTSQAASTIMPHTKRSLRAASKAIVQREKDREERKRKSPSLSPPPPNATEIPSPSTSTTVITEAAIKTTIGATVKRKKRKINAQKIVLPSSQSTDSIDNLTGDISWNTYLTTSNESACGGANASTSNAGKPVISTQHTSHTKKDPQDETPVIKKEHAGRAPMSLPPAPHQAPASTLDLSCHSILPNSSYIAHLPSSSKSAAKPETKSKSRSSSVSSSVGTDMDCDDEDIDNIKQLQQQDLHVVNTAPSSPASTQASTADSTDVDELDSSQYSNIPTQQQSSASSISASSSSASLSPQTSALRYPSTPQHIVTRPFSNTGLIALMLETDTADGVEPYEYDPDEEDSMPYPTRTNTFMDIDAVVAESPNNFFDATNALVETEDTKMDVEEDNDDDAYSTATSTASPSPISPSPVSLSLDSKKKDGSKSTATTKDEVEEHPAKATSSSGKYGFWNALIKTFTGSK